MYFPLAQENQARTWEWKSRCSRVASHVRDITELDLPSMEMSAAKDRQVDGAKRIRDYQKGRLSGKWRSELITYSL